MFARLPTGSRGVRSLKRCVHRASTDGRSRRASSGACHLGPQAEVRAAGLPPRLAAL